MVISFPWLLMFLFSLFFSVCLAQDVETNARKADPSVSVPNQPSPTSSTPTQTHIIQVGLADHKFKPDITQATIGDTVEFRFYPANHSVVRAEYGMPCIPFEMTGSQKSGFFSGFNAVDKVVDDPPKYSIKINDTHPIFFYCSASGSCVKYGMVGAINPNASTPLANQQKLAKSSTYMLNPGEPFPPEMPVSSNVPNATTTSMPVATNGKKKSIAAGVIASIVIAAAGVTVLVTLLFLFWSRNKTLKDEVERKLSSAPHRIDSNAAMIQDPSSTNPESSAWQSYSTRSPSPTSQPQHDYNAPISSTHPFTNPSFPLPQQDQKYQPPSLANHPAFALHTPHTHHHHRHTKSPEHILPTTHTSPRTSSYPSQTHHPPQQARLAPIQPSSCFTYTHPRQRFASPHCVLLNGQVEGYDDGARHMLGPAPPPYGVHVNSSIGPQEMEGTPMEKGSGGGESRDGEEGSGDGGGTF